MLNKFLDSIKYRKIKGAQEDTRVKQIHFFDCTEPFYALVICDLQYSPTKAELLMIEKSLPQCKVVIYLGDLNEKALSSLKKKIDFTLMPQFGVLGDKDHYDLFDKYGIDNLHCKHTTINGIRFAGFEGACLHRKQKNTPMYNDYISEKIAENVPNCDILLTHDIPRVVKDYSNKLTEKSGMSGIGSYLQSHRRTKFHLHGLHGKRYERRFYVPDCESIGMYRIQLVKFDRYGYHII